MGCATTTVTQQDVTPELFEPELEKGKIFVFANHAYTRTINIRVNGEERQIKHAETQIFDLQQGKNSLYTFSRVFGEEARNCTNEPYTFNTEMFQDEETHYFLIQSTNCLMEIHVTRDEYLWQIENPRPGVFKQMTQDLLNDLANELIDELIF